MLVAAAPARLCRTAPPTAVQWLSRRLPTCQPRHTPPRPLSITAAAAAVSPDAPAGPAAATADAASSSDAALARPSVRHQPPLDKKFRRDRKAAAETLAREKRLPRVQVGVKGITQPVVDSCLDVLMKHELVRVKLGEGCGLEREQAVLLLEEVLDAVAVHAIGFTITLYRQQGLPLPSNYQGAASGSGMTSGSSSSSDEEDVDSTAGNHAEQQQQQQAGRPKAKAGGKQQRPAKTSTRKQPPPEKEKPPSIVVL